MYVKHSFRLSKRHILPALCVGFLLLSLATFLHAHVTHASQQSTRVVYQASGTDDVMSTSVSCTGSGCDGKGPFGTGCWFAPHAGATILQHADITAPVEGKGRNGNVRILGTMVVATVNLWWSPLCQTNWAQIVLAQQFCTANAIANRNSSIERTPDVYYGYRGMSGCTEHTPMVYAPNAPVQAWGSVPFTANGSTMTLQATVTQRGFVG